jgi:N-methylhydantoinase A/oxoprolinase/acetone carboxylase beta subunit
MTVRVGVDVGGTFTKAVACRAETGEIVARAVVPTTHGAAGGVASGVAEAVAHVTAELERGRLGPIALVAHSTTHAVNALLEGDTATVGVLAMGRQPDLRRARKRTQVGEIHLAPGRKLTTVHRFLDVTGGVSKPQIEAALDQLTAAGCDAVCVSESFGVDDASLEVLALQAARDRGVLACGGHELSGLYGLELRTVTAAINASILPSAVRTARVVEKSVAPGVPLLVMRGDGGAADLASMARQPLLTAFSGPAASVAGALRHLHVGDGVVVEVGGTSTNVSCIRGGRPVLAYVRVLDHVTCVRSIDVRVVGVAGGSLIRVESRLGRRRITGVGPRSAHIAGLPYCSFVSEDRLAGASAQLISPLPGDPNIYAVVENRAGQRFALTPTCAANALGIVARGAYAAGSTAAARRGFDSLAVLLGCNWQEAARRTLEAAAGSIAEAVRAACAEAKLSQPELIGLGGGAGALVPAVAGDLGAGHRTPPDAEVISSVGDALSIVRVEVERSLAAGSAEDIRRLHGDAENAAVAAGASPGTLRVESVAVPERGALRVVATGSVALETAPIAAEEDRDQGSLRLAAKRALGPSPTLIAETAFYSVFAAGGERWAVIDRNGAVALEGSGRLLSGSGPEVATGLSEAIPAAVRHIGPMSVAPAVRILRGARLVDLSLLSSADAALDAALSECRLANGEGVVAFLSRS